MSNANSDAAARATADHWSDYWEGPTSQNVRDWAKAMGTALLPVLQIAWNNQFPAADPLKLDVELIQEMLDEASHHYFSEIERAEEQAAEDWR